MFASNLLVVSVVVGSIAQEGALILGVHVLQAATVVLVVVVVAAAGLSV